MAMALRPHEVVMDIDRPAVPFLIVDVAERRADVGIGQVAAEGQHPVDPHLDVLILGKLIEISGNTTVERQRHPPRLIEDQEIGVTDPELVTTAAGLRRTEQIVEICTVPGGMPVPVVAAILRAQVHALVRRQIGSRRERRGHAGAVQARADPRTGRASPYAATSLYPCATG